MPIFNLLTATGITSGATTGTVATGCGRLASNNEGLIQSEVGSGTAVIKIEGRMSDNSSWTEIDSTSHADEDTSIRVAIFPQMRATLTHASGTCSGLVNLYTI